MKLYFTVLFLTILTYNEAKLITTKTLSSRLPQNAIIAIQIIDPHENKTKSKNLKRTIESSIGYGYQGTPKYEIYKYSQHDIPSYNQNQYIPQTTSYQVPNAVPQPVHRISNYFQPGTVLFSTINKQGQLGDLSSQFPGSLESQQYPIPVIILRVHPDQLTSPLYAKLPQNHLHASTINSIDINSLLSNHIQNSITKQPIVQQQPVVYQQQYQEDYENSQTYAQPQVEGGQYQVQEDYQPQQYYPQYQYDETQDVSQSYQTPQDTSALPEPRNPDLGANYPYSSYQAPSPIYQQPSPVESHKSTELLTHENYPSDKHTQVIFKRSKGKSAARNKNVYSTPPQVQSSKINAPSPETRPQSEKIGQSLSSQYYTPNTNYYTIQYSEEQGYTHQKVPSEKSYNDVQAAPNRNYVYVSSDPTYNHSENV